jgi:phytoene dehydrogenase-like protein
MDLLGSLCRTCGAREGLSNEKISAASLGNLINTVDSGNFYVDGGAKKLMESLTFTITASSGVILRDINVEHMEFEETDSGLNRLKATCVVFSTSHGTSLCARALKSVVSGVGVLSTYLTLIPRNSISDEMKHKLSCLSEARPKVKIVFLLSGTAEQIGLKTTDYYEILKSQSLPEIDSIFLGSEQYRQLEENIHDSYVHLWSPSAQCVDE